MSLKLSPNYEQAELLIGQLQAELVDVALFLADQNLNMRTKSPLVAALNHLFVLLQLRFSMNETEGFLHEVVDVFPAWTERVDTLWVEQALLYEDLREIRDHLQYVEDYRAAQSWVSSQIREWVERLRHHDGEVLLLSQTASRRLDETFLADDRA